MEFVGLAWSFPAPWGLGLKVRVPSLGIRTGISKPTGIDINVYTTAVDTVVQAAWSTQGSVRVLNKLLFKG